MSLGKDIADRLKKFADVLESGEPIENHFRVTRIARCRFCESEAIGVFSLPDGCLCYPEDREQSLCLHHVVKATPLGEMILTRDLSRDGKFTHWWMDRCNQFRHRDGRYTQEQILSGGAPMVAWRPRKPL